LKSVTPARALQICGPEIVVQERRGVVAAVVFELKNVSSSDRSVVTQAFSASVKGVGAGGSAEGNYKQLVERALQTSELRMYVHVQGGPGESALSPILENPGDLATVRSTLAAYARDTNGGNAAPLAYQTEPLGHFADATFTEPPNLAQDTLWEIYEQYSNLTNLIRQIDELVKPTAAEDDYLRHYVSEDKRRELLNARNRYDSVRDELRQAGLNCLGSGPGCSMPAVGILPRLTWPAIPASPLVVGISRCPEGLGGGHGLMAAVQPVSPTPPTKGQVIGYYVYELGIIAAPGLLDRVELISADGKVPVETRATSETQTNALASSTVVAALTPIEPCVKRPVDPTRVSRYLTVRVLRKADTSVTEALEAVDRFGRRTTYQLDKFN
jgi:hypothetical protein